MKFGKLIDGVLVVKKYSTPIVVDGISYITSDENLCRQAGYKEVVYIEPTPEEGYNAVSYDWIETDTQIIQTWTYEEEVIVPYEETVEGRVDNLELTNDMLIECILEITEVIYA